MSAGDREQIRSELMRYISSAAQEARQIRECRPPEAELIRPHLRGYILGKYMLPAKACASESLRELTDASLARMMRVSPELVEALDTARSCAGATSAMVKKALLFQAMERDFQITLPADRAIQADNIASLASLVAEVMAKN